MTRGVLMRETEIRAIAPSFTTMQHELKVRGFEDLGISDQLDLMLDYPDARMFRSGQKLRIRVEGETAVLTYKGRSRGGLQVSDREEIDVTFAGSEVTHLLSVFESLGYPLCFTIPKRRHKFRKGSVIVTFDDWPIIGCLVEIEGDLIEISRLAADVAPGIEFRNYRLKELFQDAERRSGSSLAVLQGDYELANHVRLGRIDLLMD